MHEIQKNALDRLLAVLVGLKAEYRINLPDGTTYGTLEVKPKDEPKGKGKRNSKYPHGERAAYVQSVIAGMEVGDVIVVPLAGYPIEDLASSVASTASRLWGPATYISKRRLDGQGVEILRQA